jgi:hypothetical protein
MEVAFLAVVHPFAICCSCAIGLGLDFYLNSGKSAGLRHWYNRVDTMRSPCPRPRPTLPLQVLHWGDDGVDPGPLGVLRYRIFQRRRLS